jgi:arylsulfatase A-like enzyme/Tfp pilus assembly protein PilF
MIAPAITMREMPGGGRRERRRYRGALVVWAGGLFALCIFWSCSRPRPEPTARHLVLVTIDTLRADRVGVYSGVDLTPQLDRIAREGAYAANAMTHVPLTRPSHATVLSGLLPWELGMRDNLAPAELPSSPLLAEILKGAGFHTGAFVSSIVLARRGGFGRGFDKYDDEFPNSPSADLTSTLQKRGSDTLRAALGWLDGERTADRIALWIHLYEPHDPYEPPEPYASRFRDRPYDGEVAYVDTLVGQLDEALERLGLKSQTLLIVASDHGEGLGDHEETLHGFFVYQSTLAVPLIMRGPGVVRGGKIEANVGLVDILPTAVNLLGVDLPRGFQPSGNNLASALRGGSGPTNDSPQYGESLVPLLHFGWSDLRVLRRGSWKYILAPRPELYDLASDPHELRNLVDEQPSRASALRATLGRMLDEERRVAKTATTQTLPADVIERLGALGYVSGGTTTTPTPGADPKDKILEFRKANEGMRSGILALNRGDFASAARAFEELLGSGIESFESHFYLARAYVGLKRPDRAAAQFEQAARRAPRLEEAWTGWAESRFAVSGPEPALAIVREGRKQNPNGGQLAVLEGEMCLRLRRPDEAVAAFQAALPLLPKDAVIRQRLGELQRDLGQVEAAVASFRDAVAVDPGSGAAWNALGMTLGGGGQLTEAEQAFRAAVARDPNDHRYTFNLGLALARQGRGREARQYFEKTLQLAPDFAAAREELKKLAADHTGQ